MRTNGATRTSARRLPLRLPATPAEWRGVVRVLAAVAAVGMFLVYVMGTVVTNTGSGEGCGGTWPLCHGKWIPEFAVKTAIEYSHRVVTGIEGVLIVALAVGALVYFRERLEVRVLVPVMLVVLVAEAELGALVVAYPKQPIVLAVHFGNSLVTLVSVVLLAAVLFEARGSDAVRDRPRPRTFPWVALALLGMTYIVGYLGAYIEHLGLGPACPDWPLCKGAVVPALTGSTGIVFAHRSAALVLLLATAGVYLWARRLRRARPDLARASGFALILVALQALAGAYVVFSGDGLFSRLTHSGLLALYFLVVSYLLLHALLRPAGVRARPPEYAHGPARSPRQPRQRHQPRPARQRRPEGSPTPERDHHDAARWPRRFHPPHWRSARRVGLGAVFSRKSPDCRASAGPTSLCPPLVVLPPSRA